MAKFLGGGGAGIVIDIAFDRDGVELRCAARGIIC